MMYCKTSVVFLLMFVAFNSQAQLTKNLRLAAHVGKYIYQGDLTPNILGAFNSSKTGWGLYAQKPVNNNLSYRINFTSASLQGNEAAYKTPAYRQQRAFKFTAKVKEISAIAVANIKSNNYDDRGFTPYAFVGFGLAFTKISKDYAGLNTQIFDDKSEVALGLLKDIQHGTPKVIPFIPVGAGVEYSISPKFSAFAEGNYRIIYTDYLDGYSYAANPLKKDKYFSVSVGLIFKFGMEKGIGCPAIPQSKF
jgi:hypothetical protein